MVQNAIEAMLRQKLGLDASSVGARLIERAVSQRQLACHLGDRAAYVSYLQSSPQEMNHLIEAVVVPETWFFRDKGPFDCLRQYCLQHGAKGHGAKGHGAKGHDTKGQKAAGVFRVLSLPCSTGEEPYSIAITLLEAGLKPIQFHIDAVDISQQALLKAEQGLYRKKSFRGDAVPNLERYFQLQPDGYLTRSIVRESVHFSRGNVLEPHFLLGKQYEAIFCRNLLIYLDQAARDRVIDSLDRALLPLGLLFLGAAETSQMLNRSYQAIDHPFAFAYQKLPSSARSELPQSKSDRSVKANSVKASSVKASSANDRFTLPPEAGGLARAAPNVSGNPAPAKPEIAQPEEIAPVPADLLETAKQLADRGELMKAAQICESYLQRHPTQGNAYLLLGEIYQGMNQPQQAERSFQRAVYLNPDAYEALIHLALLKEQQGNRAEAERLRKRAQRLVDREYKQSQGN